MTKKPRTKFLKDGTHREWVIQAAIISWLETTSIWYWRQNSGVIFFRGRKIFLGPVGAADITVIGPSARLVGLEVKTAKGKPNKDQIAYAKRLTDAGGLYFIVRSVADAKNAIAEVLGAD